MAKSSNSQPASPKKSPESPESDGNNGSNARCTGVTVLKKKRRYSMFELLEVDADGAFLGGKLLLEPGETLRLELAFDDDRTTELDATVVSADTKERPGIRVAWSSLSATDRELLSSQ